MFAADGAQGEAGIIRFYVLDNGVSKCYTGNYIYGEIKQNLIFKLFPQLENYLKAERIIGWKHKYVGMGNSLFIKDSVYDLFCEYVGYAMEDELFTIYPQVAEKILMDQWETR